MFLFDFLYFLIILITLPYWIKFLLKKEYRQIIKKRIFPAFSYSKEKKRIWIHAVSVGEVSSLRNLIYKLIKDYNQKIVLSVTTPSGFNYAFKEYKQIEVVNAPIDLSFIIKNFYQRINPTILILNELEIWPNWIFMLKKKRIPIILINGRVSQRAFKRYHRFRFFLRPIFNRIDLFLLQSEFFKDSFKKLKIKEDKLLISGNIKADEAIESKNTLLNNREIIKHLKISKKTKKSIIVIASSHDSDEKQLLPVIKEFFAEFSFIIVPRHINRIKEIKEKLDNISVRYSVWSQSENVDLNERVLIFDSIGFLFNIQKISDMVFMGGTFDKKIGSHNLYEPASLGKLILGGPHYNNFPEIGAELEKNNTYIKVSNKLEISNILKNIDRFDFKAIEKTSKDLIYQKAGSIKCTLKEIQKLI